MERLANVEANILRWRLHCHLSIIILQSYQLPSITVLRESDKTLLSTAELMRKRGKGEFVKNKFADGYTYVLVLIY